MVCLRLGVATFALTALAAGIQQSGTRAAAQAVQGESLPAGDAAGPAVSNAGAVEQGKMLPVRCELERELDTKRAKRGDPVVMKTIEKATLGDGVVIPKGTRILGRVTDVKARGKEVENASLLIELDEVELKGGEKLAVVTELQSLSPAQSPDVRPGNTAAPGAPLGESAGPMGPAAMAGGAGPGTTRGAQLPDSASPAAPAMAPGQSPEQAGEPGRVVATQGNMVVRTTAIPGVLIAANANGQPFANASGALIGAKKDVHLDEGTRVWLEMAVANGRASH